MKRLATLLLMTALPLVASCSDISGGPFEGSVVEEGSGKPIEGATVVVKWFAAMSGMNGPWYPCYHVEVATTGKDGRFHVPKWTVNASDPGAAPLLKNLNLYRISSIDKPIETTVYMPGYVGIERNWRKQENATVQVHSFQGSNSERVEALYQLDSKLSSCVGDDRTISVRRSIYEEAKANVRNEQDAKRTEALLVGIEATRYGQSKALDLATERRLGGPVDRKETAK